MSQDKRSALAEDTEVAGGASREQARKLQQALNLVASFGDGGDTSSLEAIAHLVPAALQRTVEKLEKERQWEFLWFILEVEWIRQRIEELDRMIEEWQRENEDLKESISQSRNREQELRRAEEQRDFERDPQTGRFKNKAVEQAVADYEKRFGQVDRDNPDMLVLVLQWTRQQEQHAQADWWEQIGHNNRKIEKAKQEREHLEETYDQRVGKATASLEDSKAKLEVRVEQQGLSRERADRLAAYDQVEDFTTPPGGDEDIDFLGSDVPGFLAGDEFEPGDRNSQANRSNSASLDLEAGGIQCSIDVRTAFGEAADPSPQLVEAVHETGSPSLQPAAPPVRPPGLA